MPKIKLQIKNRFTGLVLFEHEKENNTIRDTVLAAIKSYADLSYADLSYADLSYADLRYADLSSAKTDKRYIQIGCIGSVKRTTTYCFDDDIVWCGCFRGSLEEFEKQVRDAHAGNEQYLKEYTGAIAYIKSLK